MHTMQPKMNAHDRDGLGYAMMTEFGLWGERWFRPDDAFRYRREWSDKDKAVKDMHLGLMDVDPRYNYFVENDKVEGQPAFAVIMHARAATGPRVLLNVHPFVREGVAMIHNGVIGNENAHHLKKLYSTCDSETILNSYVDHKVDKEPDKISEVARDLAGSYTCGVLTHNKDGVAILDVFKSSPSLSVMYIKELDAIVYATSSAMVVESCKELKWKMGNILRVKDDKMIRMDARTGRFLSTHSFFSSYIGRNNYNGYGNGYAGRNSWDKSDFDYGVGTPHDDTDSLPPFGCANRDAAVVDQSDVAIQNTDPNNDDAPALSPQEEIELSRAGADEKKRYLTTSAMKKSPKVLELDLVRKLSVNSNSKTGKDLVDTIVKPTLH